jgi:hydroxymethylpyrimidine pyrophosphatase-like HAD family hydrolase
MVVATTPATDDNGDNDTSVAVSSSASSSLFRMIALDLDGTLLQSDHQMSDETRDYLRYLDEKGIIIVIATGRAAPTVYEHIERLNLPHPLPVVCSNGSKGLQCSVVVHRDEVSSSASSSSLSSSSSIHSEELFSIPVPDGVARKTIDLANELGYVSQYYVGDYIFANPWLPHHWELTELYKDLTGSQTIYVSDRNFEEARNLGLPSKQLVLCPCDEQDAMMEAFQLALNPNADTSIAGAKSSATIVRGSLGWFLEVLHPDVCKGFGLQQMCKHLNIPLKDVVAFGDGDNDIEFIQMAGKGIVMKNGRDVCKEVADEVISYTNDDDGVRKTLQRMEAEGSLMLHP